MLLSAQLMKRFFWVFEVLLLAGTATAAASLSRADEWHPAALLGVLAVLVALGEWLSVEVRGGELSGSFIAIMLAMSLLGQAPAVALAIAAVVLTSAVRRLPPAQWLNNLSTFAVVAFVGALIVRALAGDIHNVQSHHLSQSVTFGLIVLLVCFISVALNFFLFALDVSVEGGRSIARELLEVRPLLVGELAAGALATILAVAYRSVGLSMLVGSIGVLVILQRLTVALLRSERRAEHLRKRSTQLVRLQLGVVRTLVKTLGKRDKTSERHAAAVAAYAKALAIELGCDEKERDVVRTAGLLHEVGKFVWPDRVLHAEVVKEQDLAIVRSHPQEGAILVGALDGYAEASDAILYHHERIDGGGYPAGLIGKEIPLPSRILAICSIYDTITVRESYRSPMTPEEAMAELRNAARNGQLDSELVESFIVVLNAKGVLFARDADFETELEFERRVREMAEPDATDPPSRPKRSTGPRPTRTRPRRTEHRLGVWPLRHRTLDKG